jgi:CD2 antigen cytoplasmic tail-binding protein 2
MATLPGCLPVARCLQTTRKEVNTAGYDSDSSDDGEGVVLSRKPGAKDGDEESDDDMFADDAGKKAKAAAEAGAGKKKQEKYLALGDIEGQEFGAGGSDDDEEAEPKPASGLDGPMGVELSSFNMKDELEEGKFTEDGAYVAKGKDAMEVHDKWLEGVDTGKAAMRKAREAKKRQEDKEADRARQELEELQGGSGREGKVAELVGLLDQGETVMQAMQRLGGQAGGGPKKSWAERLKEKKRLAKAAGKAAAPPADVDMDADAPAVAPTSAASATSSEPAPAAPAAAPSAFDRLSALTSDLTALGQLDIYSMSREALQRLLPAPPRPSGSSAEMPSAGAASQPPPPDDGASYEYRFKMDYIKSLPEGERPVEREVFGACCSTGLRTAAGAWILTRPRSALPTLCRPLPQAVDPAVASARLLRRRRRRPRARRAAARWGRVEGLLGPVRIRWLPTSDKP